jgi:tartronate-semialdehyde synthase
MLNFLRGENMLVAEAVVKIMEAEGITQAFGIPGAGINPVYKYLEGANISHLLMRHEEAAVHAADGYFRSSGNMALAICTSGPGATNFVTGLYTAQMDCIPLLAITGQGVSGLLGKDAFQCVDIAKIAAPVCKKTWCVLKADDLPGVMQEAFYTAREGKSGPVLIDLPLDIQKSEIDFDITSYKSKKIIKPEADKKLCEKAIDMLFKAEKPIMIMGGGVILSGAEKKMVALAEYMKIPVVTTYMAKGGIPEDHPLHVQHVGIQVGASNIGNRYFLDSDVVLGVGCRFTDRHTGNVDVYKGSRKFIHVNISPAEIGKIFPADVGIVADAGLALDEMLILAKKKGEWKGAERVSHILKDKAALTVKELPSVGKGIKPQTFFACLNKCFGDETLWTTGCGNNQIWSGQFQRINKPRKYHPSGGAGTLGFDIPAAIGASLGANKENVVCVMGDFGFTFLVEELAVAVKAGVPLTVVILNNASLSLIRQNQVYAYKYEYAIDMDENKGFVDYVKVSEGFGCKAERVIDEDTLCDAFQRAAESKGPYVVEVLVEDKADCDMGMALDAISRF